MNPSLFLKIGALAAACGTLALANLSRAGDAEPAPLPASADLPPPEEPAGPEPAPTAPGADPLDAEWSANLPPAVFELDEVQRETLAENVRLLDEAMASAIASLSLPGRPLALDDAIRSALANNPELAAERLAPAVAEARILSARGAFDAVATAGGNVSRSATQTSADDSASLFGQPPIRTSRSNTFRGGLSKFWATGTRTAIDASAANVNSNVGSEEFSSTVAASVRQSLLRGMRPSVNLAPVRQAEIGLRQSHYQLRAQVIDLVASVERTYWNLALAHEILGVRKFSLDLATRQLERIASFVEVGRLSPLELTSGRAEVASRRRDYIDAKNALERLAIDMLSLVEKDFADGTDRSLPVPADEVALPELAGTDDESVRIAMLSRPDLAQARLDLENGELDVVQAADGLLPRLDLVGSYALSGRGIEFGGAFDAVGTGRYDQWNVGLEFEMPLPNRRARGDVRAARFSRDQQELAIENLRRRIRADTLKARIELENRLASVEAARAALLLEEQKLVNEEEKWKNGLTTNLDVFQAQRDLVDARSRLLQSIADALLAETDLYVQEGSLLEVRGLEAEGGDALK